MQKLPKEVVGVVIAWATWLSGSMIYVMTRIAVLEDRAGIKTAKVEHAKPVWAYPMLFQVPDLIPAKKEKQNARQ